MVRRIVSGGQTGADRAALDVALALGLTCGGWVPRGRLAEDGVIPERYPDLTEADSAEPRVRTELNVRDSDATVVFTRGAPRGGSALTLETAARLGRPALHLDVAELDEAAASSKLAGWLGEVRPAVLNVAGSRQSEHPTIYALTRAVLLRVLSAIAERA